jgi:hypothetical protein
MKTLIKLIGGIVLFVFIIQLIAAILIPIGVIALGIGIYKLYKRRKNIKAAKLLQEANEQKKLENTQTIEYKMRTLLTMAQYNINDDSKRTSYKSKNELNLLDMWYKFLDLRAKLHLNNTSTSREEAVLHLMCDEVLERIQFAEVEVTDEVRKEFIIEHVKPLLHDILEIMEGIRPIDSISINAYQLLNPAKAQNEKEEILMQLMR